MFGFLKKESGGVTAPATGKCIRIEEVPDAVFSQKMMGDGFAVIPSGDTVAAPVSGEIVMVAQTKHAFGMKTKSGIELLVHIGLDTVELNGEGFTVLAKPGSRVKAGEAVIRFDKAFMEGKGLNMTTMVIFTGGYDREIKISQFGQDVTAGEVVLPE
ncbi:MAG: PTS glucose transporter subunit IIA [Lachnospiraceae bacterium]|nr:PTS glucose transporter subunit IIA [Lachnospiraceae bacterium]